MFDLARFNIAQFEESAGRAAALLRLLSNERRLMILCQLIGGELSVGTLQGRLGLSQSALSQSALSQHLARLRADRIVATRREGQTIFYRIIDPAALQLLETLADLFCPPDMRSL